MLSSDSLIDFTIFISLHFILVYLGSGVGVEPTDAVIIVSSPIEGASTLKAHRLEYNLLITINQMESEPSRVTPLLRAAALVENN